MKKLIAYSLFAALATSMSVSADDEKKSSSPLPAPVLVPKELSKDQTESCEAVICLAGGGDLAECVNPLKKYYNMKKKYRGNFLSICPKD